MATIAVTPVWTAGNDDVFALVPRDSLDWGADVVTPELVIYRALDSLEEATGPVVGVEVIDFLRFERWDLLPDTGAIYTVSDLGPVSLVDALKRCQADLLSKRAVPV